MFNAKVMSDADIYEYTSIHLTSIDKLKPAHEAIKILKMMVSRPILDTDLANSAKVTLSTLRSKLLPQTSADFWYDNFVDANGEISGEDRFSIASLVEDRRTQISFIEASLERIEAQS